MLPVTLCCCPPVTHCLFCVVVVLALYLFVKGDVVFCVCAIVCACMCMCMIQKLMLSLHGMT